jgi:hypothetical protein
MLPKIVMCVNVMKNLNLKQAGGYSVGDIALRNNPAPINMALKNNSPAYIILFSYK